MFNKLLFFYGEAKVYFDADGNAYTDSIFDEAFWDRYLKIAKNLVVCFRKIGDAEAENVEISKMRKITDERIKCYGIRSATSSIKDYFSVSRIMYNRKVITELVKQCDAAIVRLPTTTCNAATGICRATKTPYMIEVVGDPFAALFYHSNKGKLLAPLAGLKMKRQVKRAEKVLYVSRAFMQQRYPTKGESVGCPDANIPCIDNAALDKRLLKIQENNRSFCLGLIGSLNVNYRGHDTLIKALSVLRGEGYDCKVRFLGGGNTERWKNYSDNLNVAEFVEFSGTVPSGAPVYEWIDNIDILVMPTKVESLGRAVIEAMSRGCPVIGTRTTALGELVSDDCLVNPDDVKAVVAVIKNIIDSPEYAKYCAYENFYRAHKYLNSMTDPIRTDFFKRFLRESER